MKQLIAQQVQFILLMTMSGMSLMAGYDVLRLVRWLFPHGQISIAVEDIFYWSIVSVPVFYLFLEFHDGIIRWYGLVAVFSGIVLYEYGFSRPIRSKVAAFFNRIRRKWRKRWEKMRERKRQQREKEREIKRQKRKEEEIRKKQKREELQKKRRQKQEQVEREKRKRREQEEEKRRQRQAKQEKQKKIRQNSQKKVDKDP